ncbi:MAG: ABC transporter permease [Gemmataceae bacterium]
MDMMPILTAAKYHRWLPYYAVLKTDLRSTPRNWVWRTWVIASLIATSLYLTHKFAVYRETHIVQTVDKVVGNLLHWSALGTTTLVMAFAAGAIAAERGSLADSVLCRGISRYQFFLAKLHARLISVLCTYLFFGGGILILCGYLFPGLVTWTGCAAALGALAAMLAAIVCCGLTVSALCNSQMLALSLLWIGLYTVGFLLTFLPSNYLTPDRLIEILPSLLRGEFDRFALWNLTKYSLYVAMGAALVGMVGFSRKDV